jgi:hypothetical protein
LVETTGNDPDGDAVADGARAVTLPHLDNRTPWPMGTRSFAAPMCRTRFPPCVGFVILPPVRLTDPAAGVLG